MVIKTIGDKKMFKEDLNFLEFPLWLKGSSIEKRSLTIKKPNGVYEIKSSEDLPGCFDQKVLNFLLHKIYATTEFNDRTIETSRNEIALVFFGENYSANNIKRIVEALDAYAAIMIKFEGIFFDGECLTTRVFHIIDSYKLEKKSGKLTISFNEDFVAQLRNTKYFKLIDFNKIKALKSDSSLRLYELFCKQFADTTEWHTTMEYLADQLLIKTRLRNGVEKIFISDVLDCLKTGIEEINEKLDFIVTFEHDKKTKTFVFKINKKNTFIPATHAGENISEVLLQEEIAQCMEYFEALSPEQQHTIMAAVNASKEKTTVFDSHVRPWASEGERILFYMKNQKLWNSARSVI